MWYDMICFVLLYFSLILIQRKISDNNFFYYSILINYGLILRLLIFMKSMSLRITINEDMYIKRLQRTKNASIQY